MTRRLLVLFWFLLALPLAATSGGAQGVLRPQPKVVRPNPQQQQRPPADPDVARRQLLQRQIRQSLWLAAKQRIGLTDEQMTHLEQTTQRFDQRRRALALDEKALRTSLRAEAIADTAANQNVIASSMERLLEIQHQRVDLQIEEQKEFGTFMTPLQRAKFQALQEQVRQRMQELLRARPDSAGEGVAPEG